MVFRQILQRTMIFQRVTPARIGRSVTDSSLPDGFVPPDLAAPPDHARARRRRPPRSTPCHTSLSRLFPPNPAYSRITSPRAT